MVNSPDKPSRPDQAERCLEAVLARALTAYQRGERHGEADWQGEGILDAELVPIAREAFSHADDLPSDEEVLSILEREALELLGEGYHVIALAECRRRFVVKYAKHFNPVPPLASPAPGSQREWAHDHGVRGDGSLHPAIWQHVRAFEAYGPLAVPSRVYIADSAFSSLTAGERRALERFRAIGIVRSLGREAKRLRVNYPDDFPHEKRASEGLEVSVVVLEPLVTPLSTAVEDALRSGDVDAARELEARYREFTEQLWRCGVPHLDFSMLNIGLVGSASTARLQIFDPHIGAIDVADSNEQVRDPLSGERSIANILRSSRDGSRWALWRVEQQVADSEDVPSQTAKDAATLLRDFHVASEGIEEGRGTFGFERFNEMWEQRETHQVNTVMHAQLWALARHPVGELLRLTLEPTWPETVYQRALPVLGHDDAPLAQFRAALRLYAGRPLLLIANVSEDAPKLRKHWGRLRLPAELDVQDDPAIHYHLRDLFTGEVYVRSGEDLARQGLVITLAPHEVHVLQVEDVAVADLAVEQSLAAQPDISAYLVACSKRVGVVGDVHGELRALKEVLHALGFVDARDRWCARDGTLVLTGDVGHGPGLPEVFDFIHRLGAQADALGGCIVWTLGNHDLYADGEGGQGGKASHGYRLWPQIREAAIHPERHPGLRVQAVHFAHGKLFVHGGILPHIVELTLHERGAGDAETVASYVNDVLRQALVERERISVHDLPHEIFRVGTSHARERRLPGESGYEPAGVFTPDLRELDHYRYHAELLPQIVGHTASSRGEIRYSPGSWLRRDYIAIDVGRQHGIGNAGLLLTDFGWVAVTPGGSARLVEVSSLFVKLSEEAATPAERGGPRDGTSRQMLGAYFQVAKPERRTPGDVQEDLFADLSPTQAVSLERFLGTIRETGRSVIVTDLDKTLTAFLGVDREHGTVEVLVNYLAAGGVLVFSAEDAFDGFYVRLLKHLVLELGARSRALENTLLILSGGSVIFTYQDGAYRRTASGGRRDRVESWNVLAALSKERSATGTPVLDPKVAAYLGNSAALVGIDPALARTVGIVIDIGDAMLDGRAKPLMCLHRGYERTINVLAAATAALRESGRQAPLLTLPEVGETVLWTFERPHFSAARRVRVQVGGSGFVHAGVARSDSSWDPVFEVPLVPTSKGGHEAVLPLGVNAFTFFWTETSRTGGHPGHWEQVVFQAVE